MKNDVTDLHVNILDVRRHGTASLYTQMYC